MKPHLVALRQCRRPLPFSICASLALPARLYMPKSGHFIRADFATFNAPLGVFLIFKDF